MKTIIKYITRLLNILRIEKLKNRQFGFFPVRLSLSTALKTGSVEAPEKVSRTRFSSQKFASRYISQYCETLEVTNFYIKWVTVILLQFTIISCEDVIDVPVQTGPHPFGGRSVLRLGKRYPRQ